MSELEKTLIHVAQVKLSIDIVKSTLDYIKKNHPEIFGSAFVHGLNENEKNIVALTESIRIYKEKIEAKKNAAVQRI